MIKFHRAVLLLGLSCTPLWAQRDQHLLDGAFTTITDVQQLPASVKQALTPKGGSRIEMAMANPGHPWNEGCVVKKGLPMQRLIFAGASGEKSFVYYETGGYVHVWRVKVFSLEPSQTAILLWTGVSGRSARNIDDLRSMITSGAFQEISGPRIPPQAPAPARRGAASTARR